MTDPTGTVHRHSERKHPEPAGMLVTDLVSYVDPTIETGRGYWFFCTRGSLPFGMASASARATWNDWLGREPNPSRGVSQD